MNLDENVQVNYSFKSYVTQHRSKNVTEMRCELDGRKKR